MFELALLALLLAALPAQMVLLNLFFYRSPLTPRTGHDAGEKPSVSVLIPARNEERSIRRSVESVLASRGVELEVIVMDDHSEDRTAAIVEELSAGDPRVRLESAPGLPAGWCGKQHACRVLARAAHYPVLVFMDADVSLAPYGLRATVDFLEQSGADLVSGIPRQTTGTLMEKLVIPLIHFVLLGFLPVVGMRLSRNPSFAAGCGQLSVARREAYERAGGHAAIRASRHDGIMLPRAFRKAELRTDLFDATAVASCRMYRNARDLWFGFAKNATEGMASPAGIELWTALLFVGQVLPFLLLILFLISGQDTVQIGLAASAVVVVLLTRGLLTARFRQSWISWVLHPLGVLAVLAIQWFAWWHWLVGKSVAWKGRVQAES